MTDFLIELQSEFVMHSGLSEPGAARVLARCEELAQLSSIDYGVCRTYLTNEHKQCNQLVQQWMQEAGMIAWEDQAGNCWGRYDTSDSPQEASVILGSHLDTVVNSGKYDGILGVLCAIEIVDNFSRNNIQLPCALEVVGFADEEGTRFGATLLGSRAVAGTWDSAWFDLLDAQGVTLSSAMDNFGLQPGDVFLADRSKDKLQAYLELHIEQGPVLEGQDLPVGIVTSIAGARRFIFRLEGMAGHAGTVPMSMRRDPLIAAAHIIIEIEKIAQRNNIVATVGKIESFPGAVNVISGACEFSLDVRSGQDNSRDHSVQQIQKYIHDTCTERNIKCVTNEIHNASAVKCASWIQRLSEQVLMEQGFTPTSLMSGAGHDAMAFDGVTDIGMLFLRCAGGVSHNPAESVTQDDVHVGLTVFSDLIQRVCLHPES